MKDKTGGPAFPGCDPQSGFYMDENNKRNWIKKYHFGMTLRQWYAGKALAGELACQLPDWINKDFERLAKRMFGIADAMIEFEEKEKK